MQPSNAPYTAFRVDRNADGTMRYSVGPRSFEEIGAGDVVVRVEYSSVNYKDALSALGSPGVTKDYPHQPGIDAAGVVVASETATIRVGSAVIVGGEQFGARAPGGWGTHVRVPARWIVARPPELSAQEAMAFGTAGFTAGLCVRRVAATVAPHAGEVLVTGATGGVGSFAVAILGRLGYDVVACTTTPDHADRLRALGAKRVVEPAIVGNDARKPLASARWAAVIDGVGGSVLSSAIRATGPGGVVAACGNAAGAELALTVLPFILRGVTLAGIDSTAVLGPERAAMWQKLATDWRPQELDRMYSVVSLAELGGVIDRIAHGRLEGRVVVRLPDA